MPGQPSGSIMQKLSSMYGSFSNSIINNAMMMFWIMLAIVVVLLITVLSMSGRIAILNRMIDKGKDMISSATKSK